MKQVRMLSICAWCGDGLDDRSNRLKLFLDWFRRQEAVTDGICKMCQSEQLKVFQFQQKIADKFYDREDVLNQTIKNFIKEVRDEKK